MPRGKYKNPIERAKKISLSMKGKNIWMIGKKHTEETKQKMKIAHLGKKYKTMSEIGRKNISLSHRGLRLSEETCKKLSIIRKGHPNYLLKHSEEAKKKISESHKGEKNYRWISDRTQLKRFNDTAKDRRSYAYANWRREIWKRDNWKCKINNKDCNGRIFAHHILGYTDYPELRYNINNGITLCHAHHPLKRAEEKRLSPYFQELVSVSKENFC